MRNKNLLLICNSEIRSEIIFPVNAEIACGDCCQANAILQPGMIHELPSSCIVNTELGKRSFLINKSASLDFPLQVFREFCKCSWHLEPYFFHITCYKELYMSTHLFIYYSYSIRHNT